ncbi:MAG: bestrophin family ion channel [Bacteroidota bacterium]
MIVKRNFHPWRVWQYIRRPMWWVLIWAPLAYALFAWTEWPALQLSFTPIGVLGSALAIFIAFRNNSAYGRWWEARQIWSQIVQAQRVLARLVITFADSHAHQEQYDPARSQAFKQRMIYRCIAWAHALRLQLRRQSDWEHLKPLLPQEEFEQVSLAQNKPNALQLLMGQDIYRAMANGTLGGFDSFQMEGQLLALANQQAAAERIKETPLPRQYDFFTRVFVWLFATLLPFGLLSLFQNEALVAYNWLSIPLTILLAGVFVIMERTGAANEDPFENQVTDVPMSTISAQIERDLREMLGEEDLPAVPTAEKGYLF